MHDHEPYHPQWLDIARAPSHDIGVAILMLRRRGYTVTPPEKSTAWLKGAFALFIAALSTSCAIATAPPQSPTPPQSTSLTVAATVVQEDRSAVPGLSCSLIIDTIDPIACDYHDFRTFFQAPVEQWGFGFTVHFAADGFIPYDSQRFELTFDDLNSLIGEVILKKKPTHQTRHGLVRLAGRVLIDDDGPFLGVGATCMWCGWGYLHDRGRLDADLACIAGMSPERSGCPKHGVDYVRVLGVVGPTAWVDRTVDQRDPQYDAMIAGFTDHAYDDFGLRVEWTIFGGTETTRSADSQGDLVSRFVAMSHGREQKIIHWEVANEAQKNGFSGADGLDRLHRYATQLRTQTPIIVAITSPIDASVADVYDGSSANMVTIHLDRSVNGTGGMFRPIRQAREMVDQPRAWSSNEPIGIDSSVASDSDPTRLVLSAVYTWLNHGATHVAHSGAGIRGGGVEDRDRGRQANFWEQPTFAAQIDGTIAMRAVLPVDLPNFPRWENGNSNFPGYPFDTDPIAIDTNVLRAFCLINSDARMVCVPIAVQQPTPFRARQAMSFDVRAVPSGEIVTHVDLQPGQTYTQQPTDGVVFSGTLR